MKRKSQKPMRLINIKVNGKDRRALLAAAEKYAGGNLSAWLRFAGLHFKPVKTLIVR